MTEPSPELSAVANRRRALAAKLHAARLELIGIIRAEAARGVKQVDIVRETGYTREHIRRIVGQDDHE